MNTSNLNNNTFIQENKKGLLVLLIIYLLSSVGMFGQEVTVATDAKTTLQVVGATNPVLVVDGAADIEFMTWFMGSNQSQYTTDDSTTINDSSATARKKQIISSGATPNRLLYKTLLKKVVSQANAIV